MDNIPEISKVLGECTRGNWIWTLWATYLFGIFCSATYLWFLEILATEAEKKDISRVPKRLAYLLGHEHYYCLIPYFNDVPDYRVEHIIAYFSNGLKQHTLLIPALEESRMSMFCTDCEALEIGVRRGTYSGLCGTMLDIIFDPQYECFQRYFADVIDADVPVILSTLGDTLSDPFEKSRFMLLVKEPYIRSVLGWAVDSDSDASSDTSSFVAPTGETVEIVGPNVQQDEDVEDGDEKNDTVDEDETSDLPDVMNA
jgi:hypothetical protein